MPRWRQRFRVAGNEAPAELAVTWVDLEGGGPDRRLETQVTVSKGTVGTTWMKPLVGPSIVKKLGIEGDGKTHGQRYAGAPVAR
jgi:hypothetical protein